MSREMKIGMHVVFIDAHRQERDALVTAIHGDAQGRTTIAKRKAGSETEYETDEDGRIVCDYIEPGKHWPCINLVVVSENDSAQDQYGRQIDERHTSIVHWGDSTAIGYCFRFSDEKVDWSKMQPTIS